MKITKKSQNELAEHSTADLVYALMCRFSNFTEIGVSLTNISRFEEPEENRAPPYASLIVDARVKDYWGEITETWNDTLDSKVRKFQIVKNDKPSSTKVQSS